MITINDRNESRALYQDLQRNCPHYFTSTDQVQCITDPSIIADFERETGERIGVLYKMNDYEVFVVDLIKKDGQNEAARTHYSSQQRRYHHPQNWRQIHPRRSISLPDLQSTPRFSARSL